MARIGILTASDKGAAGEREDSSGDLIERLVIEAGHVVTVRILVPDDRGQIASTLRDWCDYARADIIMTTGGTGLSPRDVTPEATRDVAEREAPGIASAILQEGLQKTPFAALSRGIAVTRGTALIVNLPGNPRGVRDGVEVLLPLLEHISELLAGPVEHSASTGDA